MSTSNNAAANASPAVNEPSTTSDYQSRPSSRRRNVVVEKKSNAEDAGANGVIDDKMISNGKDLSHTIRGESTLERSKELSHLKKGLVATTISPRRKKIYSKAEKPRWHTVLNILIKNLLLLAALLWLGQTIWSWTDRSGANNHSPFHVLDYENRIAEVETSLKTTSKMLQVQLDVVDKKIGSEIGIVTEVLTKQLEEKGNFIENEMKKLDAKSDNLEKKLRGLIGMDLLTKSEFNNFWKELIKSGSLEGSGDVTLDEVRSIARSIVEKEIEKHAADGLGMVDYALFSGGAKVVRHSEPFISGKANSWFAAAKGRNNVHANAQKMLEPSFGEPGQCFPLQGNQGFVDVRLRTGIIPEAVTLEHVSKSVAYDRSSAPKDCRVFGWYEAPEDDPSMFAEKMVLLAKFSYDLDKSNVQTIEVEAAAAAGVGVINMVRLEFTSNHGSSALTCIYRLRVHGHEPSSSVTRGVQA